ncbi:hypothetical protein K438DRAFT_2029094 [Mycena galopus ATCC 62051]|nr:hypothetical protein K438DRAFT_2029094 [Mycena galopus ATCC 62051]
MPPNDEHVSAAKKSMPEWKSDNHLSILTLELDCENDKLREVVIYTNIQFETRSQVDPGKGTTDRRPDVVSSVCLDIKMPRREIILGRSYSSIGFLVHRTDSIATCDSVPSGFKHPAAKHKRVNKNSVKKMVGCFAGLAAGMPTSKGGLGYTRGTAQASENADERPEPECDLQWDGGTWFKRPGKDYKSHNFSWRPASDRDGVPYEMQVNFGLKLKIFPDKLYAPDLPAISCILRHQIVLWIYDSRSSSKGRGILVVTSSYIPDIYKTDPLVIQHKMKAKLSPQSEWVRVPRMAENNPVSSIVATSIGVAALDQTNSEQSFGLMAKLLEKLKCSRFGETYPKLTLYQTVSRGWNSMEDPMWRDVLGPGLDKDYAWIQFSDGVHVWSLQWQQIDNPAGQLISATNGKSSVDIDQVEITSTARDTFLGLSYTSAIPMLSASGGADPLKI